MPDKIRIAAFHQMKAEGRKIVGITAYDYAMGRIADEAGVDFIHVGDSVANLLGYEDEIPVTLQDMIHHAAAVRRGVKRALLMADMPFMTFKVSPDDTLRNAARLIQEAGVEAVKLEGGREICPQVSKLVHAGIPVMGHIGVQPQSVHAQSGFLAKGKTEDEAGRLLADALALEEAGCFAIVLEVVKRDCAAKITRALRIPTIGVGSGVDCDGQIMVVLEVIGLSFRAKPRVSKHYAEVGDSMRDAISRYATEVREGAYPDHEHSY